MNLDVRNEIVVKAKTKPDGCYRHKGVAYRVVSGNVTHFAERGRILEAFGAFDCEVGRYENTLRSDEAGQKILKKIKGSQS